MIRFLRNVRRALKYSRVKHIPTLEFIAGVEDRWRRPIDRNSRVWLQTNPVLVDLLHQMLGGQLVAGDETLNHRVHFLFVDKMFFSSNADPGILKGKDAFASIWDKFHESHPDAAILIAHAFKAFWTTTGNSGGNLWTSYSIRD